MITSRDPVPPDFARESTGLLSESRNTSRSQPDGNDRPITDSPRQRIEITSREI
jgi:hypothetical protein